MTHARSFVRVALTAGPLFSLLALLVPFSLVSACGRPSPAALGNPARPTRAFEPGETGRAIAFAGQRRYDPALLDFAIRVPWTDSYWPDYLGAMANRWQNADDSAKRSYVPVTRADVVAGRVDPARLRALSPAEKFGIVSGDAGFAARMLASASPGAEEWVGYCNGWSIASLQYAEPRPVDVTFEENGRRYVVPFGSSDVKALLTYNAQLAQTNVGSVPGGFFGRCDLMGSCRGDLNAGTLHLLLVEMIGRRKTGLILDLSPGREKWNFPVFAMRAADVTSAEPVLAAKMLAEAKAANPKVERVALVRNAISYRVEIQPEWDAVGDGSAVETENLCYALEIDARGEVVGGEYVTPARARSAQSLGACDGARPDYAWFKEAPVPFSPALPGLEGLYRASVGASPAP